jgi:hypothetical protein
MTRKLLSIAALCALLVLGSGSLQAAPIAPSDAQAIAPHAPGDLNTTFKINVVFVGYEESDIDETQFMNELPSTYDPLVRAPNVYYGIQLPVHIHGDYEYDITYAPDEFEERFFAYLEFIGTEGPLTVYQEDYNAQEHATGQVEGPVLYIDAPLTELWLMQHGRSLLGLDVANYTIFFVNWYGHTDFSYHVYTKTDDPDPDTGYNFGIERPTRKLIAWGGSHGRTWFYDLSAGPEAWTDNWNVDDADVDGDDAPDYRMPPVWEYGNLTGYRPFDDLSGDLGKVARYVAINLLFTSSPLYDPLVSEPFPGKGKRMFITMFEDDPGASGLDWIDKSYILKTMRQFQKQYKWKSSIVDLPLKGLARNSFRIWAGVRTGPSCYELYGDLFSELFCYFDHNRATYLPAIKPNKNYIGGIYAFNTTDARLGDQAGLLGYADDDWESGTPSYVFEFDTPDTRDAGYGFSTTTVHEFGHHIGMSHPHDGYDSQSGVDYDPTGEYYYAWSGDESHTIMSYIDLAFQFGWFDRDNMGRFLAGRYLERAAEIAAQLGDATGSREAGELISRAQADANSAREAYQAMDYELAVTHAKASFDRVYRAAQLAGLNVPITEPVPAGGPLRRPKMVDPIRDR